MRSPARAVGLVLAAIALVLAVAATRAVWLGGRALADGDAAATRGDQAGAIAAWRTAARWYVPGVGACGPALARLEKLAKAAEDAGDRALALDAWQAIRTSIRSIAGLTRPYGDRLARADLRIAALLAAQPQAATAQGADRERLYGVGLAGAPPMSRSMLILAALGLATWILGGVALVRQGVAVDGGLARGPAVRALVTIIAGVALWLVGVALA